MFQFVGTVPDIFGLVWLRLWPKSGSRSKISYRILDSFRGPFRGAEKMTILNFEYDGDRTATESAACLDPPAESVSLAAERTAEAMALLSEGAWGCGFRRT